jgi:hypothetical protein
VDIVVGIFANDFAVNCAKDNMTHVYIGLVYRVVSGKNSIGKSQIHTCLWLLFDAFLPITMPHIKPMKISLLWEIPTHCVKCQFHLAPKDGLL